MRRTKTKVDRVTEAAVPAEPLRVEFPRIALPIRPPFPPAEAKSVTEIPAGNGWLYEPKWDGFRCLVYRKGSEVLLQSKAGQPLGRYFPELVEALARLKPQQFVLDGEIVILVEAQPSFDDLLLRIHPAESRIRRLAREIPATFIAFDILMDERGREWLGKPLRERRARLETFLKSIGRNTTIRLSPATTDLAAAQRWIKELTGAGFDGVVAKRLDMPYASGERTAMQKIKRIRSADCVVGGFRYSSKGGTVGSLLLGLYNESGQLDHVGFTSSFSAEQRRELKKVVDPLRGGDGFSGRTPGGPSRWSTERSGEWEALQPRLVCEVTYDHFSQGRFRHGTKFLRWRPEKAPRQCTFEQVRAVRKKAG